MHINVHASTEIVADPRRPYGATTTGLDFAAAGCIGLFLRLPVQRKAPVKPYQDEETAMAKQNAHQIADWNGPSGERWVVNQARLDAMLAVFGQAAIEAAAPVKGERVLDIGCGSGASSFALASLVGAQGWVLGVDVSESLIERARALAPPDTTARFQVADASSAKLPEGEFDILFSRFGVMFFDDPTGAFAHMRRALRPGGRVAFICWRGVAENGSAIGSVTAADSTAPISTAGSMSGALTDGSAAWR